MRDNPDHTAGRDATPAEARKIKFALMLQTMNPAGYPSRQAMRAHARTLLKQAERQKKAEARAKLTKAKDVTSS